MKREIVTINGTVYDKHTGMPIGNDESHTSHTTAPQRDQHSHSVHHMPQRSKTLDRRYVKRSATPERVQVTTAPAKPATPTHISRTESVHKIERFAKHPVDAIKPRKRVMDIAPTAHPMAVRAEQKVHAQKTTTVPKPSQIIKQEAMAEAMERTEAHPPQRTHRAKHHKVEKKHAKASRFATLAAAGASLVLLGGYFTYINMPNLSVRVAAAQAGVDASYPGYKPNGYSLTGPVAFEKGNVKLAFKQNGGNESYTISQETSGWDSSAVLDNYIQPKAGDNYTVNRDNGLTVYSYDGNAAWVNKGILYKIEGDSRLSPEQIVKIATSM